jgi:hypothetical protein
VDPREDDYSNATLRFGHSLVGLVLAACDESDDQNEISELVDVALRTARPGRTSRAE